jgi:hypothetical protein
VYLISTGGNDKCAMVWKTTFGSEGVNMSSTSHKALELEDDNEDHGEIDVP